MELGSEYSLCLPSLTKTETNVFTYLHQYPLVCFFDSGRSAIRRFVSLREWHGNFLLPEYICESVISCFPRERIRFYRILPDFSIDVDDFSEKMNESTSVVYLMHYFGYLQSEYSLSVVRKLADRYGCTILEDTTHSFFSAKETIGDYMICSLRKWFPVGGAGVLYSRLSGEGIDSEECPKNIDNEKVYGLVLKDLFLRKKLECNPAYRKIFAESEERLNERTEIRALSDLDTFLLECMNVDNTRSKRKANAEYLITSLKEHLPMISVRDYKPDECPFALPIRSRERDRLRAFLAENRIYCAVHWPFDGICEGIRKQAIQNAKELLSLPIDQRYSRDEMDYLTEMLQRFEGSYEA